MSGTYVGLRVEAMSAAFIRNYCAKHGIKITTPDFEKRLHVTLIYSRVAFEMRPKSVIYSARITDFALFSNEAGANCVLVAKLDAPAVTDRHIKIREMYGATHDYPSYMPHITLTYDCHPSFDISRLPIPAAPIHLLNEYVEPLQLNWTRQA